MFGQPTTFPALQTLEFIHCKLPDDFMESLTQYAFNRTANANPLGKVTFVTQHPLDPTLVDALKAHVPVVDVGPQDRRS